MNRTLVVGAWASVLVLLCGRVGAEPEATSAVVVQDLYREVPIEMSTGELVLRPAADLFANARGMDLTVQRTYRSGRARSGPFGYGWQWNHGQRLNILGEGVVEIVTRGAGAAGVGRSILRRPVGALEQRESPLGARRAGHRAPGRG